MHIAPLCAFFTFAVAFGSGCVSQTSTSIEKPAPHVRVSDQYRYENVVSYFSYDADIRRHLLVLVTLKSGIRLPMLCRVNGSSMSPLTQCVTTSSEPNRWSIAASPEIEIEGRYGTATMCILVELRGDRLWHVIDNQEYDRRDPQPRLARSTNSEQAAASDGDKPPN
jgi:hypothetical protein